MRRKPFDVMALRLACGWPLVVSAVAAILIEATKFSILCR
jgi:hypothetical protein